MSNYSRIVKEINKGSIFDSVTDLVDSTISWNQGDLLFYDVDAAKVKPIALTANATGFLGIADFAIISGKPPQVYNTAVDASVAPGQIPGPFYGVVASLTLKTGDSINPGAQVYAVAADPQQVSVAGSNPIGVYQGPVIASAAAGTQIEVLLGHRYPNNVLSF